MGLHINSEIHTSSLFTESSLLKYPKSIKQKRFLPQISQEPLRPTKKYSKSSHLHKFVHYWSFII